MRVLYEPSCDGDHHWFSFWFFPINNIISCSLKFHHHHRFHRLPSRISAFNTKWGNPAFQTRRPYDVDLCTHDLLVWFRSAYFGVKSWQKYHLTCACREKHDSDIDTSHNKTKQHFSCHLVGPLVTFCFFLDLSFLSSSLMFAPNNKWP